MDKLSLEKLRKECTKTLREMFLSQTSEDSPYLISMAKKQALTQKIWREGISKANNPDSAYLDQYKSVAVTGGGIFNLMVKDENEYKLMVSYERLFDVLWPIHLNYDHELSDSVIEKIQKKYFVPKKAIEILSKYCDYCQLQKLQKPYYCCNLELVQMDAYDHCFNSVMVCEDVYTGFIHLRPLSTVKPANQICVELFKIFMDFGTPEQLNVSNEIFVTAVDLFKKLTSHMPFDIQISRVEPREEKAYQLKALLKKWSDDSASYNWAIGCYIVQQQLNSKIQGNRHSTPFENVFASSTTLQNMPGIDTGASGSGTSDSGLDTRLEASSSKSAESKVPVDILEDGVIKEIIVISDGNSTTYATEKEYASGILVDDNTKCNELTEEQDIKLSTLDDKEEVGKLRERLSMILGDEDATHLKCNPVLVEESLKLSHGPDDIPEHDGPNEKLIVLSDDDDDDSMCVKNQQKIIELSSDSSTCDNLNEELDEYPKCISLKIESDEMSDVKLKESDTICKISSDGSTCSESKVTLGDIVDNNSEATLDADISRYGELTDETNIILDDDDQKPVEMLTDSVAIFTKDNSKLDRLIEKLNATLNDDLKCVEMERSEAILSDPKCVKMDMEQVGRLHSNVSKSDELTTKLDTIMDNDDSQYDKMETEAILSAEDLKCIAEPETVAISDVDSLKHDELTKKSVDRLAESSETLHDTKTTKLAEEPNIQSNDQSKVFFDHLKNNEQYQNVLRYYERMKKINNSKPKVSEKSDTPVSDLPQIKVKKFATGKVIKRLKVSKPKKSKKSDGGLIFVGPKDLYNTNSKLRLSKHKLSKKSDAEPNCTTSKLHSPKPSKSGVE